MEEEGMLTNLWRYVSSILNKFLRILRLKQMETIKEDDDAIQLFVRIQNGKLIPLKVEPQWTIAKVKQNLYAKTGNKSEELKIIFAGKELEDSFKLGDCDIGQQSVIHAVRASKKTNSSLNPLPDEQNLQDQITHIETNSNTNWPVTSHIYQPQSHFYIYCSKCKDVTPGKLRVRCADCKFGTLILEKDPCCWDDVLVHGRMRGKCLAEECLGVMAEFFFKCSKHPSQDEEINCVALDLIRPNLLEEPCLACLEIRNPLLKFPCNDGHCLCLECFQSYCVSRLNERKFVLDTGYGYTLPCPGGCEKSIIKESHHFHILGEEQYCRYQQFATEECLLGVGGVLCPQPGCGAGIIPDDDCQRVTCVQQGGQGCGFVFCRYCKQGFHLGECLDIPVMSLNKNGGENWETDKVKWDEASKRTIQVMTKPCPKCRTPTERDGGCMHMVCSRSQCNFNWCWICQVEWTRDCMGNHWFG